VTWRQLGASQRLAVMADVLAGHDGIEPWSIADDLDLLADRTAQRLADLVEPARSSALDKLGEDERAIGIALAWLRPKLDPLRAKDVM